MKEVKGTEKQLTDQGFEFEDLGNYQDGLFKNAKGVEVKGDNKEIPINLTSGGIEIPEAKKYYKEGVEIFSKTGKKTDNAWIGK